MNDAPTPFGTVFWFGLRRVVRWRKVLIVAALACAVGSLVGFTMSRSDPTLTHLAAVLERGILSFGLPLIALALAADGFAFEVSARTLVYHLVRPVSRATVFFARFLAGVIPAAAVSVLLLFSVVATSGVRVEPGLWLSLPVTATAGVITLGAVYYTLGALFRHGLVVALIYTFVVETALSVVPGSMQRISVMFHVRSLHHGLTAGVLPDVPTVWKPSIVASNVNPVAEPPPGETLLILAIMGVVALAIGAWRVSRRDWALKE